MKLIKLINHFERPVWVNADMISTMWVDTDGYTRVVMTGDGEDDEPLKVLETPWYIEKRAGGEAKLCK